MSEVPFSLDKKCPISAGVGHEKMYRTDAIFLQTEKIYHHPPL
jgi:hypothetical protein